MDTNKTKNNNSNRRRAFRIIEQVDLFFHKLDPQQQTDFNSLITQSTPLDYPPPSSNLEQSFPSSSIKESDSLNVNISASGISFTCKEQLMADDYIMVRVLLLSSMTVITACCKVIYSKPSNPYEKNQYPYLVGAQFVNLKPQDEALLSRHVHKKKNRQLIANGLWLSLIMMALIVPDVVFDFIVGLGSFLIDEVIEITHLLYELFEYSLDHLIEHTFHTEIHQTQIIVFYIQLALALALTYPLARGIYSGFKQLISGFCSFYIRKKSSVGYWWGVQSLLYQVGLISTVIMVTIVYLLFFV